MSGELGRSLSAQADAAAYGHSCEIIAPRLAGLCRRLVGPDTAEDLAQDVLLRVWERRAMFDPKRGPFAGWVFTIARNAAVDHRRSQARSAESWNDLCVHERNRSPQALEARVLTRIHAQDIRRSVARLPEPQRRAIWEAFWAERSHQQIAAAANLPLGTIKGRIRLGLSRVQGDLSAAVGVEMGTDITTASCL
jgi:RNA polymerase sigma-70 factor, ECF subfamily